MFNLRTWVNRRSRRATLPLAFLDRVFGWWKAVLPLAMNCRLWRFYVVRRNKLILGANGRHCYADHACAQDRNPKQFHFRLRAWQRAVPYTVKLRPHLLTRERR
ncbi:conserved hypothetical protein [Mesorhizobium escarrei]|uniref:Uncharacterized protein n=1 Tax=Mesorhizobium escarrei TaxID=666018 RepID=A0ABN8JII8_9HYPH|nr:conserved hypothetical protein [Mesorhizobium escarrei]